MPFISSINIHLSLQCQGQGLGEKQAASLPMSLQRLLRLYGLEAGRTSKDAARSPHVTGRPIAGAAKQELWRPIPAREYLRQAGAAEVAEYHRLAILLCDAHVL